MSHGPSTKYEITLSCTVQVLTIGEPAGITRIPSRACMFSGSNLNASWSCGCMRFTSGTGSSWAWLDGSLVPRTHEFELEAGLDGCSMPRVFDCDSLVCQGSNHPERGPENLGYLDWGGPIPKDNWTRGPHEGRSNHPLTPECSRLQRAYGEL